MNRLQPATIHPQALGVLALALFLLPQKAQADIFREVAGARSLAMGGAHRGLGSSNEAIWLNPAGMALTKHYSIDLQYDYAGGDRLQHGNASVVDSKSSPVAAGVSYTRDWGNPSGVNPSINRTHVGMAYALGSMFALGGTVHNISGDYAVDGGRQSVTDWSGSAGAALSLGGMAALGAVWHNIISPKNDRLLPPSLGFGAAVHVGGLAVASDVEINLRDDIHRRTAYHAGAEFFAMEMVALRGGWRVGASDPARTGADAQYVSAGIGLINEAYGLNYSLERSLEQQPHYSMLGSFQIFL